jgi:hypothetical protein
MMGGGERGVSLRLAGYANSKYMSVMSVIAPENSASAIWERTIEATKEKLDPAAARALLLMKLAKADLKRAETLAEKARAGSLTPAEERELDDYRSVGTALEFLKSKARVALRSV